jgi:hypothetical protein
MKQDNLRMVSGEGIAKIIENNYKHLVKCCMVARVSILGLDVIL